MAKTSGGNSRRRTRNRSWRNPFTREGRRRQNPVERAVDAIRRTLDT